MCEEVDVKMGASEQAHARIAFVVTHIRFSLSLLLKQTFVCMQTFVCSTTLIEWNGNGFAKTRAMTQWCIALTGHCV